MADEIIPKEALAYLKAKAVKPGFDHRDIWRQEHNAAFTVAKMLELDILADVQEALTVALEEGQTFQQFAESLKPYLVKRGWWGEQLMEDPLTKEQKTVQLGSDARLKTIYRTNMRTARAAGQWERIERNQATHPFLVYELGPSREHRLQHMSWRGIMLPADDPWWETHFPPNGWGCKCRVRQISRREAERLLKQGGIIIKAPPMKFKEWTNKRTGEVERVPDGIDPGWDYRPKSRQQALDKQLNAKRQD